MSEVIAEAHWLLFVIGFYLTAIMLLLFIIVCAFRKWHYAKISAIGLLLAVSLLVLGFFLTDWKIPGCYDAKGNLLEQLPQCRFL